MTVNKETVTIIVVVLTLLFTLIQIGAISRQDRNAIEERLTQRIERLENIIIECK